jgi:hypothetical protein
MVMEINLLDLTEEDIFLRCSASPLRCRGVQDIYRALHKILHPHGHGGVSCNDEGVTDNLW